MRIQTTGIMRNTYTPYRFRRQNCGAILVLVLVLAGLISLLATSNLERSKQRTLLNDAMATRAQADDVLMHTLQHGLSHINQRLRREDFNVAQRGLYETVIPERLEGDYRRFARLVPSPISAMETGYWIELFSEGSLVQNASGKFYLSCRLLISTYAQSSDVPLLFAQTLVETMLLTLSMPTSDTNVIKLGALPKTRVIATKTFN